MARLVVCPECGQRGGVRIVWGMPAGEDFERAERGEIILGGCLLTGNDPDWSCRECGHLWVKAARAA
ncbi:MULTISPECIES: hypothetical protein [unclassified Cryobacterium]|uniref:hypothetical protein n=1 Tax=unclassified Cryobacterium TaxID=2649013 RepID=UPI00144762DD|nr:MULTISPECIES: hypothetical protein [unclassified Cryobacterium]